MGRDRTTWWGDGEEGSSGCNGCVFSWTESLLSPLFPLRSSSSFAICLCAAVWVFVPSLSQISCLVCCVCFSADGWSIWVRNAWLQGGSVEVWSIDCFPSLDVGAARQSPVDVLKCKRLTELSALPAPWQVMDRVVHCIRAYVMYPIGNHEK